MTDCPAWLADSMPEPSPLHSQLAIARLASAETLGAGGFALKSAAFENGEPLDPCFTADEEDAVAPPLEWTNPPPGTEEVVIVVEDPAGRGGKPQVHWLAWGFPGQQGKLLEGESPPFAGKNAAGNSEWLLPKLDIGDPAHEYVFQIFAIDRPLGLMPGASAEEVFEAIDGHVLAAAVISTNYEPEDLDDWSDEDGDEEWDE